MVKGGKEIFSDLKKILARERKGQTKENQKTILNKLEKNERLTSEEFWSVYESVRQEGPEVKYPTTENWANYKMN